METRKKVLHFLPRNSFSGAENVVCQMIALFRGEMDMYYCCPEGPIRQALEERNIPYLPMAAFSVKEVRRLIRQENCQLFQNPEHPQRIFGLGHPAQEYRMAFLPALRCRSLIPKGLRVDDIAQDGAFVCHGFAEIEAVHG